MESSVYRDNYMRKSPANDIPLMPLSPHAHYKFRALSPFK